MQVAASRSRATHGGKMVDRRKCTRTSANKAQRRRLPRRPALPRVSRAQRRGPQLNGCYRWHRRNATPLRGSARSARRPRCSPDKRRHCRTPSDTHRPRRISLFFSPARSHTAARPSSPPTRPPAQRHASLFFYPHRNSLLSATPSNCPSLFTP